MQNWNEKGELVRNIYLYSWTLEFSIFDSKVCLILCMNNEASEEPVRPEKKLFEQTDSIWKKIESKKSEIKDFDVDEMNMLLHSLEKQVVTIENSLKETYEPETEYPDFFIKNLLVNQKRVDELLKIMESVI